MQSHDLWNLFLETGMPEAYLLYKSVLKAEKANVLDDSGSCFTGHSLQ